MFTALSHLLACGSDPVGHEGHAPVGHEGHATGHHRFDDPAKWAAVFDDPARDAWQRPAEVVALTDVPAGGVVADLGAGTGYFMPHLAPLAGRVLALDVEPSMVAYLTERAAQAGFANVEAKQIAPDDPGLAAGSVDRVLIVDTWHHLPDRAAYSAKLAAGLKPEGRVVIVDFTLETAMGPPVSERLSPDAVIAELAKGGLVGRVVEETLPEQYVVVAERAP